MRTRRRVLVALITLFVTAGSIAGKPSLECSDDGSKLYKVAIKRDYGWIGRIMTWDMLLAGPMKELAEEHSVASSGVHNDDDARLLSEAKVEEAVRNVLFCELGKRRPDTKLLKYFVSNKFSNEIIMNSANDLLNVALTAGHTGDAASKFLSNLLIKNEQNYWWGTDIDDAINVNDGEILEDLIWKYIAAFKAEGAKAKKDAAKYFNAIHWLIDNGANTSLSNGYFFLFSVINKANELTDLLIKGMEASREDGGYVESTTTALTAAVLVDTPYYLVNRLAAFQDIDDLLFVVCLAKVMKSNKYDDLNKKFAKKYKNEHRVKVNIDDLCTSDTNESDLLSTLAKINKAISNTQSTSEIHPYRSDRSRAYAKVCIAINSEMKIKIESTRIRHKILDFAALPHQKRMPSLSPDFFGDLSRDFVEEVLNDADLPTIESQPAVKTFFASRASELGLTVQSQPLPSYYAFTKKEICTTTVPENYDEPSVASEVVPVSGDELLVPLSMPQAETSADNQQGAIAHVENDAIGRSIFSLTSRAPLPAEDMTLASVSENNEVENYEHESAQTTETSANNVPLDAEGIQYTATNLNRDIPAMDEANPAAGNSEIALGGLDEEGAHE